MNVEVGQPSVAAMEVGTEADPTSSFPLTADSVFCGSLLSDRGTPETYLKPVASCGRKEPRP